MLDRIKAWLWWRLPRLWMNRTQYAFWVMGEQERLRGEVRTRPARSREEVDRG